MAKSYDLFRENAAPFAAEIRGGVPTHLEQYNHYEGLAVMAQDVIAVLQQLDMLQQRVASIEASLQRIESLLQRPA